MFRSVSTITLSLALSILAVGCRSSGGDHRASAGGNSGFISASDWKAWVNRQPPAKPKLIVTGKVKVASAHHQPSLAFESLEKSNPPSLNLDLVVTDSGTGAEVETTKDVRYESTEHTMVKSINITYPGDSGGHRITEIGEAQ